MRMSMQMRARRLFLLMRNDVVFQARSILLTAGAAFVAMLIAWIVLIFMRQAADFYPFFFSATILAGGAILTSLSFGQMHDPLKGIGYLTLPGSMAEKYLSKLLLTSLGFAVATALFFYAFSFVAAVAARTVFGVPIPLFALERDCTLDALVVFLNIHPLLFFGAVYFKRFALLKTVLCGLLFVIALGALILLVSRPLFSHGEGAVVLYNLSNSFSVFMTRHGSALKIAGNIIRWVLPAFFIGLGYIRLTEYELHNGI